MERESKINIYKASAGSGKTYRITLEYLKLIAENPDNYSGILAVTFTNKATNEMKERILQSLYSVANGQGKSGKSYINDIVEECGYSESQITRNAKIALSKILHNFSYFNVTTIDSFFQTIFRNLSKELGFGAYLNIQIDHKETIRQAIDKVFDKSKDDKTLHEWIIRYIDEIISNKDKKSWRIDNELFEFAQKNLFQEKYQQVRLKDKDALSPDNFANYKNTIIQTQKQIEDGLKLSASEIISALEKNGIGNSLKKNIYSGLLKLVNDPQGSIKSNNYKTLEDCTIGPLNWITQAMAKTDEGKRVSSIIEQLKLDSAISDLLSKKDEAKVGLNTCRLILKNLNDLGFFENIQKEVSSINDESGQFILANTPILLRGMIDDSDAPFIFEKIGTNIRNIMIDEFQDTSRVQWEIFKPLLKECISQNRTNLIVGDPKQAIYRWRNGDWKVICDMIGEGGIDEKYINNELLNKNWRSKQNIIEFNNFFYNAAISHLYNGFCEGDLNLRLDMMKSAYENMDQKCAKDENKDKGLISIEIYDSEKHEPNDDPTLEAIVSQIKMLKKQGIEKGDIAILVRKNSHIPIIANYLAKAKEEELQRQKDAGETIDVDYFDITSNEAYQLNNSLAVCTIINALRYISDPNNKLYREQLIFSYEKREKDNGTKSEPYSEKEYETEIFSKLDKAAFLPLYEMIEYIYHALNLQNFTNRKNGQETQENYIYTFLDGVNEFLVNRTSDLTAFLNYWDKTLCLRNVPFNDDESGIRIMTIHKSKGLEFHTVIIPYCNWSMTADNNNAPLVWCTPNDAPYNQIPIIPVSYVKDMGVSLFKKDYVAETEELIVDNLNILYVATTRAINNLFLIFETPNKNIENHISHLINLIVKNFNNNELCNKYKRLLSLKKSYYEDKVCRIIFGKIEQGEKAQEEKEKNLMKPQSTPIYDFSYCSTLLGTNFRQSNDSRLFINGEEEKQSKSYIDEGKTKHRLFSMIKTLDDIPTAAKRLASMGIIATSEIDYYAKYAKDAISRDGCKDWFSPDYKVYNECDILSAENKLINRPDRVIERNGQMTIIDYKFGSDNENHKEQVERYIELTTKMGYKSTGYLWYVEKGEIIEVPSAH